MSGFRTVGACLPLLVALLVPRSELLALELQRRPGQAPRGATRLDLGKVCPGETASWLLSSPQRLPGAADEELVKADRNLAIRVRTLSAQDHPEGSASQFLLELTPLRPGPVAGVLVIQVGPDPTDRLYFALAGQVKPEAACGKPHAVIELSAPETVPAIDVGASTPGEGPGVAPGRDLLPWEQADLSGLDEPEAPRDDSWLWEPRPLEGATLAPADSPQRGTRPAAPAKRMRRSRPRQKSDRARRTELGTSTADTDAMAMPAFSKQELRELQRQPWVKMEAQRLRDLDAIPGVTDVDLSQPREAPCVDHREATRRIQRGLPACPEDAE